MYIMCRSKVQVWFYLWVQYKRCCSYSLSLLTIHTRVLKPLKTFCCCFLFVVVLLILKIIRTKFTVDNNSKYHSLQKTVELLQKNKTKQAIRY